MQKRKVSEVFFCSGSGGFVGVTPAVPAPDVPPRGPRKAPEKHLVYIAPNDLPRAYALAAGVGVASVGHERTLPEVLHASVHARRSGGVLIGQIADAHMSKEPTQNAYFLSQVRAALDALEVRSARALLPRLLRRSQRAASRHRAARAARRRRKRALLGCASAVTVLTVARHACVLPCLIW